MRVETTSSISARNTVGNLHDNILECSRTNWIKRKTLLVNGKAQWKVFSVLGMPEEVPTLIMDTFEYLHSEQDTKSLR